MKEENKREDTTNEEDSNFAKDDKEDDLFVEDEAFEFGEDSEEFHKGV